MPLPTLFAALTAATGEELDANFAALGALTPIPCAVSGTNALVLTPASSAPTVSGYANYGAFIGIASAANTGSVTVAVGALPVLGAYKDTSAGPAALVAGDIETGNVIQFIYDTALAGGAGGFHLATPSPHATTGSGAQVLATGPTLTAVTASGAFQTTNSYTVATLPAAGAGTKGLRAYVTDASVATASVGTAVVGGGTNTMPVWCNGAAWAYG